MARKSELIDVLVTLHHETSPGEENEGAVLVSVNGRREEAVWIPKSLCQVEMTNTRGERLLTLADYVAVDKGLV